MLIVVVCKYYGVVDVDDVVVVDVCVRVPVWAVRIRVEGVGPNCCAVDVNRPILTDVTQQPSENSARYYK